MDLAQIAAFVQNWQVLPRTKASVTSLNDPNANVQSPLTGRLMPNTAQQNEGKTQPVRVARAVGDLHRGMTT